MKKIKKLILYFLLLSYLFGGCWCNPFEPKFERNPNLRLLLKKDEKSLFNPVLSPDGIHVYYLAARSLNGALDYADGGDLWCVNKNGSNDRRLLSGKFCSLAISPDGTKLALSYEIGEYEIKFEGGPLIITDTTGSFIDTLPTKLPRILDIEFNSTGTKVFYYAYSSEQSQSDSFGFYSIDLDGTNEQFLKPEEDWEFLEYVGFDLDNNDSIYYDSQQYSYRIARPQFNPSDYNYIVYTTTGVPFAPSELVLWNITANNIDTLDADPFHSIEERSGILSAYWAPNSTKLVISVGEARGGEFEVGTLELWILEKLQY